ncbi:hypothetical protein CP973_10080 [Streptomyces albofaciens JCM 4342]|uniref:ribosome-inactivating family protein n=1 Tax=Streptomyces albofaciens TaxID=66866 RepID=UPI00123C403C|nr:ribosome-inactivating family protein [Streptomyces albofaciens]KAA6222248.1 hypothetical protein CP973_10080 [Streptomyces albofaciens JCM 4342]
MRKPLVAALLCLPLLSATALAAHAAEPRPAVAQAATPRPGITVAAASLPTAAQAAVHQFRVTSVRWDLSSTSPGQVRDSYTAFMRSLRDAAGVVIRGTGASAVWETRDSDEIIAVDVRLPNQSLTLYLSVRDLYLRGFSTGAAGNVVQFRDPEFNLGQRLNRNATTLPYGGHYVGTRNGVGGLEHDTDSRQLEISRGGVVDDLNTLANFARGQGAANNLRGDLVRAIAVTSEAARFRDIEARVRQGLGSSATLSSQEAREENDWGQGSAFMYRANRVPNPAPTRLGNETLNNWGQGASHMAMLLITQK